MWGFFVRKNRQRWKPPRARATRTRGEILPHVNRPCQVPKHESTLSPHVFPFPESMKKTHACATRTTVLYGPHPQNQVYTARLHRTGYTGALNRTGPIRTRLTEPAVYAHSSWNWLYEFLSQNCVIKFYLKKIKNARTPQNQLYTAQNHGNKEFVILFKKQKNLCFFKKNRDFH